MGNTIDNIGQTAQNVIDNFIKMWIQGAKILVGDDNVTTDTYAPVPFYATGAGYWTNGMWNMSATQQTGFSTAHVDWAVWTEGEPSDLKFDYNITPINIPTRPAEWNTESSNWWTTNGNIGAEINLPYIINNQIDYIGYYFSPSVNNNTSSICGFVNTLTDRFPQIILSEVYKYDGTLLYSGTATRIVSNNQTIEPENQVYRASDIISNGYLNLPRNADSFWFSVMPDVGNNVFQDNFYDTIENHNTTNNYYTDEYNNTYNEYHIDLPSGLGFDVGVGPLGVGIGVAPVVGINPSITFDDLLDILTPIVNDLNDNSGYDTEIQIYDLDHYLYEDMGDFYIEPLHQYDKLPTAPQIEQEIDFGEYPAVLAETSTAFFNMLPATFSALLAGTLVLAVLIRNIGR